MKMSLVSILPLSCWPTDNESERVLAGFQHSFMHFRENLFFSWFQGESLLLFLECLLSTSTYCSAEEIEFLQSKVYNWFNCWMSNVRDIFAMFDQQLSLTRKYRLLIIDRTSATFIDHCNYMYIFPPFDESKACIRSIASSYVSIDTAEASQAQSSVIYWTQLKSYISMETFVTFSKAFNFWYVILHRHFHDPFWTTQNVDQMNGDVCIFRCSFTIL